MLYLLQITLYTAALYLIYVVALKNTLSHGWSRVYLLLCALLPPVIPFITLPAIHQTTTIAGYISYMLPAVTVHAGNSVQNVYPITQIWIVVYCIIAVALIYVLVSQYSSFCRFVRQHSSKEVNGVKVLENTEAGPGSFGNYIFLPGANDNPSIFEHEQAHIAYRHSYDIILLRVIQCVLWPNAVLYLIRKELKMVHEFQADAVAAKEDSAYPILLLNNIFHTRQFNLSHTFFLNPVKRRIMMLQQSNTNKKVGFSKLKAVVLSTVFLSGIVYLQSCKENTPATDKAVPAKQDAAVIKTDSAAPTNQATPIIVPDNNAKQADHKFSYSGPANIHGATKEIVAKAAHASDAGYDFNAFLDKNLHYPEYARMMKIQGRVTVKFVVDEKGKIILPEIMNSPDTSLSREALAVVSKFPDWKPGTLANGEKAPMAFYLPISFKLEN